MSAISCGVSSRLKWRARLRTRAHVKELDEPKPDELGTSELIAIVNLSIAPSNFGSNLNFL